MSNLETIIVPRARDLGGFSVARLLPYARKRMVGPFIFFDHMGPAEFSDGKGMDVRPHPHIGLSTVTYLFDGEITHRDSLGHKKNIVPGDVNWMTAGKGIVHSERTPAELRATAHILHGLQIWIALPLHYEDTDPSFHHYPSHTLPLIESKGTKIKLIAGKAFLRNSPVPTFSPLFYFEVFLEQGTKFHFQPTKNHEAGMYLLKGSVQIEDQSYQDHVMPIWQPSAPVDIYAQTDCHFVVFGGEPFEEDRIIWWNLVSTSQEKIDAAKESWREQKFPKIQDETEFIPLPENG